MRSVQIRPLGLGKRRPASARPRVGPPTRRFGGGPKAKAELLRLADPQQARVVLADSSLGAPVAVGEVLRVMRERQGVSQGDLARRAGVSQAAVSQWESGDTVPSTESIHVVGFALGASVEETVALASVRDHADPGLPDDPEAAMRAIWGRQAPPPLREAHVLGWEAEIYRRAQRDANWETALVSALSYRTSLLVPAERYREVYPLADRALRLARTPEAVAQAAPAVAALTDADRSLGRGHARAAELAGAMAERQSPGHGKAWMLRQRGMSLVRMGRTAEGLERVAQSIEMDLNLFEISDPWSYRTSMLCEALLEAGDPKRAADLMGGRRERLFWPHIRVAVEHANGRAVTEAEMDYLRYWTEMQAASRLSLRRLRGLQRRQAWLKGERRTPVESGTPFSPSPGTGDRLWVAVLRAHPG